MIFLYLFFSFFKIGLFGFGGGYAMISLIHNELVIRNAWLSAQEFTDIVAVSQMTPGPIGINSATYAGYTAVQHAGFDGHLWGALGSVTATFALVLPSFILMLLISKFFLKNRKHPLVESVLGMLRPAVVGLLIAAALLLMNAENFGTYEADHFSFVVSVLIFVITFAAVKIYKASPILMIAIMGIVGFLVF
ncbi:MAG: chromate transporter [Proteobacteria bacterium]|nr:chromate transporter [Pseudomonadota bacterium]